VLPFAEVEKRAILTAVRKCGGDISKASRKLGLSRATLYRKLDKYGVR
jgi:transcriptional regulator of acetoin/glycerol metabolism